MKRNRNVNNGKLNVSNFGLDNNYRCLNNVKISDGVKLYVVKLTGDGIMLNVRSIKKILTLNLKGDSVTLKINGVHVGTLNVFLFSNCRLHKMMYLLFKGQEFGNIGRGKLSRERNFFLTCRN